MPTLQTICDSGFNFVTPWLGEASLGSLIQPDKGAWSWVPGMPGVRYLVVPSPVVNASICSSQPICSAVPLRLAEGSFLFCFSTDQPQQRSGGANAEDELARISGG